MKSSIFAAIIAGAVALAASSASAATVVGVDVGDQYLSPHSGNKAGAAVVPVFCYPDENFPFNYHYSSMPTKWTLDLPTELEGKTLKVTSATITVWNSKLNGGWDPSAHQIQLYNAGVTGANGFTRDTWTESDAHYNQAGNVQDPYLVELGTGLHAEDNPNATPWAVGVVDASYTGQASPTEAFPITFTLDVNNVEIQAQLKTDLANGYSMFALASNFPAAQSGGVYPGLVTKEGVTDAQNGTLQQAPVLTIEVIEAAGVGDWNLYQ